MAAIVLTSSDVRAQNVIQVDCDLGESIQDALTPADEAEAISNLLSGLVVKVQGTCRRNVKITTDNVTITGDVDDNCRRRSNGRIRGIDGKVNGTVHITGAHNVVIECLTVTGRGSGVAGTNGAVFTVRTSNISNNMLDGIEVGHGSVATIDRNHIKGNHQGIGLFDGGDAFVTDNLI